MIPEVGIHPGVPFSVYQSWEAVNASFLTTLSKRTPFHAKHDRDHPKGDTPAKRMGRALHSYILEPATFPQAWAVWPKMDRRTTAGKDAWAEFEAGLGMRDWIDSDELAQIEAMATEIVKHQCLNYVIGGRAEVSIVWKDRETSLLCKRRLDYERTSGFNHFETDLKSSEDVGPRPFSKDIADYGYALAAAFSIDGWLELTGDTSIYVLLAIEKGYYVSKAWQPDDDTIAAGREHYRKALWKTAECMKTGVWPTYGQDVELIRAPEWYLREHGVGPDLIRPEPQYTGGGVPEGKTVDEFDEFLKEK